MPKFTRILTSSAKSKGRKFQQYVAQLVTEIFGLEDGDIVSRPMGSPGVDLMMAAEARKRVQLSIECKKWKRSPSRVELEQAESNQYDNTLAAVAWCPHGRHPKDAMIMFDLKDFLEFWHKQRGGEVVNVQVHQTF